MFVTDREVNAAGQPQPLVPRPTGAREGACPDPSTIHVEFHDALVGGDDERGSGRKSEMDGSTRATHAGRWWFARVDECVRRVHDPVGGVIDGGHPSRLPSILHGGRGHRQQGQGEHDRQE